MAQLHLAGLQPLGHAVGLAADHGEFVLALQGHARLQFAVAHALQRGREVLRPAEPHQVHHQGEQRHQAQQQHAFAQRFLAQVGHAHGHGQAQVDHSDQATPGGERHHTDELLRVLQMHHADGHVGRAIEQHLDQTGEVLARLEHVAKRLPDVGAHQRGLHHAAWLQQVDVLHAAVQTQSSHQPAHQDLVVHAGL